MTAKGLLSLKSWQFNESQETVSSLGKKQGQPLSAGGQLPGKRERTNARAPARIRRSHLPESSTCACQTGYRVCHAADQLEQSCHNGSVASSSRRLLSCQTDLSISEKHHNHSEGHHTGTKILKIVPELTPKIQIGLWTHNWQDHARKHEKLVKNVLQYIRSPINESCFHFATTASCSTASNC